VSSEVDIFSNKAISDSLDFFFGGAVEYIVATVVSMAMGGMIVKRGQTRAAQKMI